MQEHEPFSSAFSTLAMAASLYHAPERERERALESFLLRARSSLRRRSASRDGECHSSATDKRREREGEREEGEGGR
ncbi:hypothetical protein NL676_031082 [Syzygium grande]|nr:hypothetical protein NL676_031082 [Syzygium grande]